MLKTFRNVVLAAVGLSLLAACGSTASRKPSRYNGGWWNDHLSGYFYVLKRDMTHMYKSFDRHFMNYDWDDPNLSH